MAKRTMDKPVVERRWDGCAAGAAIYHVEVKQEDKAWIHRTWGWTVEEGGAAIRSFLQCTSDLPALAPQRAT